jgi:acyl-CoA synthetase (AMP-forming)/AMP-acid ligase II
MTPESGGPSPVAGERLDSIPRRWSEQQPEGAAIVIPDGDVWSWGDLDRAVGVLARSFLDSGIGDGDRVALANFNTPEFFVALFACAKVGAVAVPLDPTLGPVELRNVIAHAAPRAVVADDRHRERFTELGSPLLDVRAELDARAGQGDALAGQGEGMAHADGPARDPGEPAFLLYTSGTTGTPKGAVHSHRGVLQKVQDIRGWFGLTDRDSILCMLPTHFGHGLVCSCLTALSSGATLVLTPPFNLELLPRVFALADRYQVTTFSSVPTIVRLLLRNTAIAAPSSGSLRYVTCASAPLHPEEVDAFEDRFGVPLLNCYGSTEAGTWSAMSPNDPERDKRSVGVAVGCLFRAVSDGGDVLPAGETGHLQLRGPSVMLGYDGMEDATRAVLQDGWLSTGDLGSVDEQDRVFLAGRSKDLIIRAGVNIYPAEVERVLMTHPDVAEAKVVGVDHEVLGETVGACVVLRPGAESGSATLSAHIKSQLAAQKCPERYVFVEQIPKTSRGKVSRAGLRALFEA